MIYVCTRYWRNLKFLQRCFFVGFVCLFFATWMCLPETVSYRRVWADERSAFSDVSPQGDLWKSSAMSPPRVTCGNPQGYLTPG